jgi:hypothetical protein
MFSTGESAFGTFRKDVSSQKLEMYILYLMIFVSVSSI